MNRTLVVMAAGMGSRYGGMKQLEGVGPSNETILEYSVYDAIESGFNQVVFIIRPDFAADFKKNISSKFQQKIDVKYVYQTLDNLPSGFSVNTEREKPLGTGHAIWCVKEIVNNPFVVINADDFYGRESFKSIFDFYSDYKSDQKGLHSMSAYRLKNTLSDFGSVNRGECFVDEKGFLTEVKERLGIERVDERFAKYSKPHGVEENMGLDSFVSMNFWGFTPDFFEEVERMLIDFLKSSSQELKTELYLPAVVESVIKRKIGTVKVLETESKWYGLTYQQDKDSVKKALQEMVSAGIYPENLWK